SLPLRSFERGRSRPDGIIGIHGSGELLPRSHPRVKVPKGPAIFDASAPHGIGAPHGRGDS
ncbi:hypothetical protein FOZ62_021647, partial [Perkinsus olseni]